MKDEGLPSVKATVGWLALGALIGGLLMMLVEKFGS